MLKLAHIINVTEITEAKKRSYLHIAQPLTMKTMIIAKQLAAPMVSIDLVAVKHEAEMVNIPEEFNWAPDISKYAWEYIESLRTIESKKPLPRMIDIIMSLYSFSDADYFIYTNLDIGLYPSFYLRVKELIDLGFDAFCINRRDLPKTLRGTVLDEKAIDLIFSTEGKGIAHPGIDCFVFKREIVPHLQLGNVYVGFPPVGQVLKTQIQRNAENFTWIKGKAWTFHLGLDSPWQSRGPYFLENYHQSSGLFEKSIGLPTAIWYRAQCRVSSIVERLLS